MRRVLVLLASVVFACAVAVRAQDSPSLGDVARQSRQQKQQKDAQAAAKDSSNKDAGNRDAANNGTQAADAKTAPAPKVTRIITNEELPEHTGSSAATKRGSDSPAANDPPAGSGNRDEQGAQWRSRIQSQKQAIVSLQQQIDSTSQSIHYAGGNCVANCVQWNERQKQKQDEVETMKSQLEEQKKQLDDMQESARKQGFGSSVYDPD